MASSAIVSTAKNNGFCYASLFRRKVDLVIDRRVPELLVKFECGSIVEFTRSKDLQPAEISKVLTTIECFFHACRYWHR